jgi:dedicator of cytokinesis protein 3
MLMSLAEAEAYEFALELCQELTNQHMALTYDVKMITELLNHQARLWERIGQSTRPKPEYFRIVSQLSRSQLLMITAS